MNQLGQLLGIIDHSFSTTLDNGEKVTIKARFDCRASTDEQIKSWIVSDRAISYQRPIRKLTASEVKGLDGQIVIAHNAGHKVESRADKIKKYTDLGLPENIAELAVDNPIAFEKLMGNIDMDELDE